MADEINTLTHSISQCQSADPVLAFSCQSGLGFSANPGNATVRGNWRNEGYLVPDTYIWTLSAVDESGGGVALVLTPPGQTSGTESGPARFVYGSGTSRGVVKQVSLPEKFVRNNNPADVIYSPPMARPAAAQIGTAPAQYTQTEYTAALSLTVDSGGEIPECVEANNTATVQVAVHVPRIDLTAWANLDAPSFVHDVAMPFGGAVQGMPINKGVVATIANTGDQDAGDILSLPTFNAGPAVASLNKCDDDDLSALITQAQGGDSNAKCELARRCAHPTKYGGSGLGGDPVELGIGINRAPDTTLFVLNQFDALRVESRFAISIPADCQLETPFDFSLLFGDKNFEIRANDQTGFSIPGEFNLLNNDSPRTTSDLIPTNVSSP